MRILQVVDVLRHKLIRLAVKDDVEFSLKSLLLVDAKKEKIIVRVLGLPRDIPGGQADEGFVFMKKLSLDDSKEFELLQEGEKKRVLVSQTLADSLGLSMKFFASRVGWKKKVISLFFMSGNPVDFRELLKLLIKEFSGRIHLERVGPRDRAKILGGFGSCGRELCCTSFKVKLSSVPMDAVRDQGIVMKDNQKVLGACGKLKCCLMYELSHYREMRRFLPHIRQEVFLSGNRKGRVLGLDILNKKVKVLLETDTIEVVSVDDITTLNKAKKIAPKPHK